MNKYLRPLLSILLVGLAATALLRFFSAGSGDEAVSVPVADRAQDNQKKSKPENKSFVSALGYLEPAGRIHVLAAPAQISEAGIPRIDSITVREGQRVAKGYVLATFDTIDRIESQRELIKARIASIRAQVNLLNNETNRFRSLAQSGVIPKSELEGKELRLLELKSDLVQAQAELNSNATEERYSKLVAPISGTVIKINSRTGERPSGTAGVMEIGQLDRMAAIIQVNEHDIRFIRLGQPVALHSENNSFSVRLRGVVAHITPKVGLRKQLSDNPKADTDTEARTIDVEVHIASNQVPLIAHLTGAKVVAQFPK